MSQQRQLEETIKKAFTASQKTARAVGSRRDAIISSVADQQEAWRRPHGFQVTLVNGPQQDIRQYFKDLKVEPQGTYVLTYLEETETTAWQALKGPYRKLMFPYYEKDGGTSLDNALSKYAALATAKMALSLHRLGPGSTESLFDKLEALSTEGYVPNTWLEELLPLVEEHFSAVFEASKIKGKASHCVFALRVRRMAPAINLLPTVAMAVEQFSGVSERNRISNYLKAIVSSLRKFIRPRVPAPAAPPPQDNKQNSTQQAQNGSRAAGQQQHVTVDGSRGRGRGARTGFSANSGY